MSTTATAASDLISLGFTQIEARAYCELLKNGPQTSYRLASAINRAPSNIYQTLDSLSRKGAILIDEAEPRTFRALSAEQLMRSLEKGFRRKKDDALKKLRDARPGVLDDHFYSLRSVEQVYDRARAMLAAAREIVLFDLFPRPLLLLREALEETAQRGVSTAGIGYGTVAKGKVQVWSHPWHSVPKVWPGQQVTIIADARECLIALLSHDGEEVRHALWTDSVYLSCLHHSGLACEIQVAEREREPDDPIVKLGLLAKPPLGLRTLRRQALQKRRTIKRRRQ